MGFHFDHDLTKFQTEMRRQVLQTAACTPVVYLQIAVALDPAENVSNFPRFLLLTYLFALIVLRSPE